MDIQQFFILYAAIVFSAAWYSKMDEFFICGFIMLIAIYVIHTKKVKP